VVIAALLSFDVAVPPAIASDILIGRAVLPATTFAPGSTSGQQLGSAPINGQAVPFVDKQPVQGFSAVADNGDGSFMVMVDNGYGAMENSSDFNLRVYKIRPDFKTVQGGSGTIQVETFIELRDPDKKIPFAIANHFSAERVLTGADLDIESCAGLLGAAARLFVAAGNADALANDAPLPSLGLTPTVAVVVAAALLRDQNLTPFDLTVWFQRVASEAKKSNSFNVAAARMQEIFAKRLAEAGSAVA